MDYTAIYRQQETGHGAHQNFYEIGIDSYLWQNFSGNWLCSFRPTYHRG